MSDVIEFLEHVGCESSFHHGGLKDLAGAMAGSDIEESLKAALLAGDPSQVRIALGQHAMVAMIMPAEEDDEGESEQEDAPEPESPSMRFVGLPIG